MADLPEQTAFDDLFLHVDQMRRALALRADLDDALEPAGGVEHGLAFAHIAADGLLAVNIRARLQRGDAMERVLVIR